MFIGHGETIAKYCLAHSIINLMESGKSADEATKEALEKMTARLKNTAGKKVLIYNVTSDYRVIISRCYNNK